MTHTEQAILEAVREYFQFYGGMRAGVVRVRDLTAKHNDLIDACNEHTNTNDGDFPVSEAAR